MTRQVFAIIGVDYAIDLYMPSHVDLLSRYGDVHVIRLEDLYADRSRFSRRGFLSSFKEVFRLRSILLDLGVTHSVSVGPKAGFLNVIVSKLLDIKSFHWFTGQFWSSKFSFAAFALDCLISRFSFGLLADSSGQARFLERKLFLEGGSIHVPTFGSISGLQPRFCNSELFRFNSFEQDSLFNVVFLGRITPDKGINTFLDAASLMSGYSRIKWSIYGPVDDFYTRTSSFTERCSSLDNVCLELGFADSFSTLNKADLLVLPSLREGFGIVLVEAQALGVPVIATDLYSLNQSLVPNVTGFFVPVGDSSMICEKVRFLYDNPSVYSHMSNEALGFAKRFYPEDFSNELELCYRSAGLLNI